MDLTRREYPALLDSLQPVQATTLLNDRVKHVGKVNAEIADWLAERRRIEELYAQALRKLSQQKPPGETSDLGIFTTPWQKVVSSAAALAESHHVLALKIESDIERPLREYASSNRELLAMSTMQGNLQSLAKDYDAAAKKADKLRDRGDKAGASKVASASSEMDSASSQWGSQAPYVFEALQAVDESRCNHLRDVLTQYQTHEVDLVEKNRKVAENTLNSILNIETADEIRTFAIRSTGSGQGDARRRSERRQSRSQGSTTLAPPVTNTAPDNRAIQSSPPAPEEKKGRLGGLKRLGTVMRRKSTVPTGYGRTSSTGKVSYSNLRESPAANGDQATMTRERTRGSFTSPGIVASQSAQEPAALSPPVEPDAPREPPVQNTTTEPTVAQTSSAFINGSAHQSDLAQLQEPIVSAAPPVQPVQPVQPTQETTRDAEGFSVPSASVDPISQAEREAAISSDPSASPFKVDILNAPIADENADADSAMANLANTLRAQAAPPRRTGTNRGRRDVRNTVFVPTPAESPAAQQITTFPPPASSSLPPFMTPFSSSPQSAGPAPASPHLPRGPSMSEASDSQSVRSSRSATATGVPIRHPTMQQMGLNSSVIETVSAWMERGNVTRSLVIGELALAYIADSSTEIPLNVNIRLDNFPALEKVAPNPAFIMQSDDPGKAGKYTVDVGSLARTAGAPTVAFKYQVHVSEDNVQSQAPIILAPVWKVEERQTSVILSYSLNPSFTSSVTLSNVILFIYLESDESGTGKPTSCQSKPAGTFSKERSMIYWRLDELALTPGAAAQKVLARFATDGQAKPGKVEARWEISGASAVSQGLGSGLDVSQLDLGGAVSDPFADESAIGTWRSVGSTRKLVSGTYVAN